MLGRYVTKEYKRRVHKRAEASGAIYYFSAKDFEGLRQQAYTVRSSDGHTLQGYFYGYDGHETDRIVVFEHGMGSGHRGYMKEIELLARHGYSVFAYDHTGCMESGGETTGGLLQSLKDLNDVLNTLKADPAWSGRDLSVIGHSWGGFSTLNIGAFHPDVKHLVAMAGFISPETILTQNLRGWLAFYRGRIIRAEKQASPSFADCTALDALRKTDARVLVIHSEDDRTVSCQMNFDVLARELSDRDNITFLRLTGKGHNPNYTEDVVRYKRAFFKAYHEAVRKGQLESEEAKAAFRDRYDWNRMTEQDPTVWERIFAVLDARSERRDG